jgi:hypothetical protein
METLLRLLFIGGGLFLIGLSLYLAQRTLRLLFLGGVRAEAEVIDYHAELARDQSTYNYTLTVRFTTIRNIPHEKHHPVSRPVYERLGSKGKVVHILYDPNNPDTLIFTPPSVSRPRQMQDLIFGVFLILAGLLIIGMGTRAEVDALVQALEDMLEPRP